MYENATAPLPTASISPPKYESRALAKGIQILERLAESGQPLTLAQLARRVQLGKASTLRLLRTLSALGYLERDPSDAYRTPGDWNSFNQHRLVQALRADALPVMTDLHTELAEGVALAFLFRDEIRVIAALESPQDIRMSNHVGRLLQPYASALGKSITAWQSPERVHALLHAYGVYPLTPSTIAEPSAIQAELAAVRQNGYARDREETVVGGECFAAPIRCPGGQVCAALSVSLPKIRLTERLETVLPAMISDRAKRISEMLHSRSLKLSEASSNT